MNAGGTGRGSFISSNGSEYLIRSLPFATADFVGVALEGRVRELDLERDLVRVESDLDRVRPWRDVS